MAAEEFQESEIIFSDHHHHYNHHHHHHHRSCHESIRNDNFYKSKKNKKKLAKMAPNSLPIKIPENRLHCTRAREIANDRDDHDLDEEMVPPHVIVGRRVAGKVAFSLCMGNGRTLKGRDLCQVRNSILKLTGFLEA